MFERISEYTHTHIHARTLAGAHTTYDNGCSLPPPATSRNCDILTRRAERQRASSLTREPPLSKLAFSPRIDCCRSTQNTPRTCAQNRQTARRHHVLLGRAPLSLSRSTSVHQAPHTVPPNATHTHTARPTHQPSLDLAKVGLELLHHDEDDRDARHDAAEVGPEAVVQRHGALVGRRFDEAVDHA